MPDDEIAVEQAGDLARGDAVHGLRERDDRIAAIPVHLEPAVAPGRVVAEPDAVDPLGWSVQPRLKAKLAASAAININRRAFMPL